MSPAHRHPPGEPVDLPNHLRHGTSYVHRWLKCRCGRCQAWRRGYDKARDQGIRKGSWTVKRREARWYVCVNKWGVTFEAHEYSRVGRCIRCGADRATEEEWEAKWEESKP